MTAATASAADIGMPRYQIERLIEHLIATLDAMDGDPDLEQGDDNGIADPAGMQEQGLQEQGWLVHVIGGGHFE